MKIAYTTLASNIYMTITLCTIIFGLLESSKITLFRDLVEKIITLKGAENVFFLHFPVTLILVIVLL